MPMGDLPRWHQVFAEDFRGDVPIGHIRMEAAARWSFYSDGWPDTTRHGTYMPSKVVSIHDGVLDLYLHTAGGVHMVAALVPKLPTMLYGRYAIRFKADPAVGYKFVCLLWPDSEVWPRDGEIDFPEGDLSGSIGAFLHHQDASAGNDQDGYPTRKTFSSWHTAITTWSPGRVSFFLDGVRVGTSAMRVPDTPMHWVLQAETALTGPPPAKAVSSHVLIDWVAAYSRR